MNVTVRGETVNQKTYLKTIVDKVVTLCTGPAGSGKSYIPIGLACQYHEQQKLKIIIVRPAIEASDKGLGFLKGTLDEKLNPYMLPATEYFDYFIGRHAFHKWQQDGVIEYAPLEYIQGRTFKDTFVVLDEAQNCTYKQLIMFVSRLGLGSKMVINGDSKQCSISDSGLERMKYVFAAMAERRPESFGIATLVREDILRHPILGEFLEVANGLNCNNCGTALQPRPDGLWWCNSCVLLFKLEGTTFVRHQTARREVLLSDQVSQDDTAA